MTSVALIGHNGTVGEAVLPELVKAHEAGSIKLVVLHRESSDTSSLPDSVEKRVVQLDDAGLEINRAALKGVEVLLSTVGPSGLLPQNYLIDASVGSPTLKTFAHSDFGANWTPEELAYSGMKVITVKEQVVQHAKEKGVPLTHFRAGLFDRFFFQYNALATDIKENKFQTFRDNLQHPLRISTLAYIGYAVAHLAASPAKIANATIQLYDVAPTGQEIVDTLTKVHGKATTIDSYSEEQFKQDIEGSAAIPAALKGKWGDNTWGEGNRPQIEGWTDKSFEELVKANLG
ncbi:hypothetical protein IAU60_002137 [Kwoniella sp. DSM 27419]